MANGVTVKLDQYYSEHHTEIKNVPSSAATPRASLMASGVAIRASLEPTALAIALEGVLVSSRAITTAKTAVSDFAVSTIKEAAC